MSQKHSDYVRDLVYLIVEKARDSKLMKDSKQSDYEIGNLMAYHEVVSLIQQQAKLFELSFEDIGMPDIDPEIDLL